MSTPDFDAAVERAARAMLELAGFGNIDFWSELGRAALQASGWEEAAAIILALHADAVHTSSLLWRHGNGIALAEEHGSEIRERARAWVAQYTQASNDSAESGGAQ